MAFNPLVKFNSPVPAPATSNLSDLFSGGTAAPAPATTTPAGGHWQGDLWISDTPPTNTGTPGQGIVIDQSSAGRPPAPTGYKWGPDGKLVQDFNTVLDANGNPVQTTAGGSELHTDKWGNQWDANGILIATYDQKGNLTGGTAGGGPTVKQTQYGYLTQDKDGNWVTQQGMPAQENGLPVPGSKVPYEGGQYGVANDHGTVDVYNQDGSLYRPGASGPSTYDGQGNITVAGTQAGTPFSNAVGTVLTGGGDIIKGVVNTVAPGAGDAAGPILPPTVDDLTDTAGSGFTNSGTGGFGTPFPAGTANSHPSGGSGGTSSSGNVDPTIGGPGYVKGLTDEFKSIGNTAGSNLDALSADAVANAKNAQGQLREAGSDAQSTAVNYGNIIKNIGQDTQNRANETSGQLKGLEAEEGPSAAQAQLQSALNQAEQSNLSIGRSGRGWGGGASNLVQAANNNAALGQQAANQSAMLRAQENAQWRQRQAANLGTAGNLDLQGGNANASAATAGGNLVQSGINSNINATTAGMNGVNNAYNTGVNATSSGADFRFKGDQAGFEANKAQVDAVLKKYGIDRQVDEQTMARLQQADSAELDKWVAAGGTVLTFLAMMSDVATKKNISDASRDIDEFIQSLRGTTKKYEYKKEHQVFGNEGEFFGSMVQDLEKTKAGRSAVLQGPNGIKMIDKGRQGMLALSAIARLADEIDELRKKVS